MGRKEEKTSKINTSENLKKQKIKYKNHLFYKKIEVVNGRMVKNKWAIHLTVIKYR